MTTAAAINKKTPKIKSFKIAIAKKLGPHSKVSPKALASLLYKWYLKELRILKMLKCSRGKAKSLSRHSLCYKILSKNLSMVKILQLSHLQRKLLQHIVLHLQSTFITNEAKKYLLKSLKNRQTLSLQRNLTTLQNLMSKCKGLRINLKPIRT